MKFETRETLRSATSHFFGLALADLEAADAEVAGWNLSNVDEALLRPLSADAAIGTLFLARAAKVLEERGVERTKLVAKLRDDPDVWPTWAELYAASSIALDSPADAEFTLERDRHLGRHADYNFTFQDGGKVAIEFKAIGLSDAEVEFSRRAALVLPSFLPTRGIVTTHALDMSAPLDMPREWRRRALREAPRRISNAWSGARGISAAVVVGHGGESNYARRLGARLQEALRQLPGGETCWAAFYWTNGAPSRVVAQALQLIDVPENVAGISLLGSVAIPGSIHEYVIQLPRPFAWSGDPGAMQVISATEEVAAGVLRRVEQSAAVRPTLLRVPTPGGMRELIHRGGEERILPFNLVLDGDPEWVATTRAPEFH